MKQRSLFFLAVLGILAVGIWISRAQHWIQQYEDGTDVLWHDDECFVLVRLTTVGWSGSRLAYFLGLNPPRHIRRDALFYHYDGSKLTRFQLKGASAFGTVVPYKGTLYSFSGRLTPDQSNPSVWRWAGSEFEALDNMEAEELRRSFRLFSEQIAAEGWSRHDSVTAISEVGREYAIAINQGELTLNVSKSGGTGGTVITLTGSSLRERAILYEGDEAWKQVSGEQFDALTDVEDPFIRLATEGGLSHQ